MGYRSDVAIAMYAKDYNTMVRRAQALKNKEIYKFIYNADLYGVIEYDKGFNAAKVRILKWDCTKWYSDYKEIQWIENFIQKIDSAIVVVGEELDDNKVMSYGEGWKLLNYVYINRSIEIEGIKKLKEEEL